MFALSLRPDTCTAEKEQPGLHQTPLSTVCAEGWVGGGVLSLSLF